MTGNIPLFPQILETALLFDPGHKRDDIRTVKKSYQAAKMHNLITSFLLIDIFHNNQWFCKRTAKTQIRQRICAVRSWSSLFVSKPKAYFHMTRLFWTATPEIVPSTCAPGEDPDQTVHSHSLIRIFTRGILDSQGCKVLHADNEDSDQTARIAHARSLIRVLVVRMIWVSRCAHMSGGTLPNVAILFCCFTRRLYCRNLLLLSI